MSIGIYQIKNLLTGEKYIGQSVNIERRFKQHKNGLDLKNPLYSDFYIYGIDNFSFTILEECDEYLLNERENYYIDKFDTINNGYNRSYPPGIVPMTTIRKQVLELWEQGLAPIQIKKQLNIKDIAVIFNSLNIDSKERMRRNERYVHNLPVEQYLLNGKLLNSFPSITIAAEQTNSCGSGSGIGQVCKQQRITCNDFFWKYKNDQRNILE